MHYFDQDQATEEMVQLSFCFDHAGYGGENHLQAHFRECSVVEVAQESFSIKGCEVIAFPEGRRVSNLEAQLVRRILHRSRFF
ncbi:hypothetical protein [Azotobacter beijerinckii]|uniref:hypothetical protein n=1 Tax=Azotobacter beijerinckii TaxID=170623 RepID=UPI001160116F|nr:hypothetical protein [Azotobacter beijerinckii]